MQRRVFFETAAVACAALLGLKVETKESEQLRRFSEAIALDHVIPYRLIREEALS